MRGKWVWYAAALVGTGIMATLGAFVRQVSPDNEFVITLGRFAIGLVCLLGLQVAKHGRSTGKTIRLSWALAGSGIVMSLFVVCYFKAVLSGPLANAAFLLYLGPLIASVLSAVWLEEGFNQTNGLLLGCAVLGTLFITEFEIPQDSDQIESLVFGLLSGLFYGLFLFLNNSKIQGAGGGVGGIIVQFVFAVLVMLPVVVMTGADLSLPDVLWVAAIGILHGFVALTLVIKALGHLKTIEYGTISYGEPVAAALIGGIAYHESISLLQIVGCLFVLVAGIARVVISEKPAVSSSEPVLPISLNEF